MWWSGLVTCAGDKGAGNGGEEEDDGLNDLLMCLGQVRHAMAVQMNSEVVLDAALNTWST